MKLFGRKIDLPENGGVLAIGDYSDQSHGGSGGGDLDSDDRCMEVSVEDEEKQLEEDQEETELSEINPQDKDQNPDESLSDSDENPKIPNEDAMSENDTKPENEQSGPQKTLKKPDKILPCPRCNSMDTKFCYYNNYNVNQPRHFCKSCQRYWTAGGTMRNVPVGAGRRKNKNAASHCHHITISDALEASRVDSRNGFHNPSFKSNGTVLSFGPDSPLCESISSGLNLADKRVPRNGVCNMDDSCNGSSVTSDGGKNGPQNPVMQNLNGFPYPVPSIQGVPWTFPVPPICPPGYTIPFYPAPYWNCNPWTVPWIPIPSPNPNQNPTNSPLGKHSREGNLINQKHLETKTSKSSIVVPKTLRIDDPEDAAKSSIWETLGIEHDCIRREGLFKALQPKGKEKKPMVSVSPVLHANPAALSRSINFQEGA